MAIGFQTSSRPSPNLAVTVQSVRLSGGRLRSGLRPIEGRAPRGLIVLFVSLRLVTSPPSSDFVFPPIACRRCSSSRGNRGGGLNEFVPTSMPIVPPPRRLHRQDRQWRHPPPCRRGADRFRVRHQSEGGAIDRGRDPAIRAAARDRVDRIVSRAVGYILADAPASSARREKPAVPTAIRNGPAQGEDRFHRETGTDPDRAAERPRTQHQRRDDRSEHRRADPVTVPPWNRASHRSSARTRIPTRPPQNDSRSRSAREGGFVAVFHGGEWEYIRRRAAPKWAV